MTVSLTESSAPSWSESLLPRRDARYLATVAALAALAAVVLCIAAGAASLAPAMIGLAIFGTLIGAGDAVTRHIANRANLAALGSAPVLLAVAQLDGRGSPIAAVLGAVGAFAMYLVLNLVSPASMGMGDVKFAPYVGAYLGYFGWSCWTRGMIIGFLAQGAIVLIGLAARRLTSKSHVAHGPAMFLGAIAALVMTLPGL